MDAAQSVSARDPHGRTAGSVGTVGCFSFYPTKNLGALGDGGGLVTNDEALAEHLRLLRSHGARELFVHGEVGFNSDNIDQHGTITEINQHDFRGIVLTLEGEFKGAHIGGDTTTTINGKYVWVEEIGHDFSK